VNLIDHRRRTPRIAVTGSCGVVANDELQHATISDVSVAGIRLERAFDPRTAQRVVQLAIELPGIDDVLWARAEVSFAVLTPMRDRTPDGQRRFWCRAGLRLAELCRRERRLLHDYVETRPFQIRQPLAQY
jgi:hypothetical protein